MMLFFFQGLNKSFGDKVLYKNLSFSFSEGIYQIEGVSGSGKSTLLRILLGIEKEDHVEKFFFRDTNLKNLSLSKRRKEILPYVSYVGQDSSLLYNLSLSENRKCFGESAFGPQWDRLVQGLDFERYQNTRIDLLSGGERQKAELIFALSQKKNLFVLDEPFSSLDQESRDFIHDFILEKRKGDLFLLVDHANVFRKEELNAVFSVEKKESKFWKDEESVSKRTKLNSYVLRPNFFGLLKEYFRSSTFSFLLQFFLTFVSLIFFSLGMAFSNFKSPNETVVGDPLTQDPFEYHQVTYMPSTPTPDLLWEELQEGKALERIQIQVHSSSGSSDGLLVSSPFVKDTDIQYVPGANFSLEFLIQIGESTYETTEIQEKNLLPNFLDAYKIFDNLRKDSFLFVVSPITFDSFLTQMTVSKIKMGDDVTLSLAYHFADGEMGKLSLTQGSDSDPSFLSVINSSKQILSVPGLSKGSSVSFYDSNYPDRNLVVLKTTAEGSSKWTLSTKVVKDIFLHVGNQSSQRESFYSLILPKDELRKIGTMEGVRVDFDLERDTTQTERGKVFIFYSIAVASVAFLLCYVLLSLKDRRNWLESVQNTLEIHGCSLIRRVLLHLFIHGFYLLPVLVLSVLSYVTWMLNLSNYSTMVASHVAPSGFYYYSLEPSYDYYDFLKTPLKLFTPDLHYLWILFLIFGIVLISFLIWIPRKKK